MNSFPPFAANTNESDHPALESIAAYLDGRLPEAERSALTAHLDSCAACYEIYTESLRFQKEERLEAPKSILPFERRKTAWIPARIVRTLSLPLAALLLVGVGVAVWHQLHLPLEPRSIDSLTASLENPGPLTKKLDPFDRPRGGGDEPTGNPPIVAFHSGATLVDLRVAIAANDAEKISDLAGNLRVLFHYIDFTSDQDRSAIEAAVAHLETENTPDRKRRLTDFGSLETIFRVNNEEMAPHFVLGAWTEAGRLATYGGRTGFFDNSDNRKSLRWFRRHLPAPVQPQVKDALEKIDDAWPAGALGQVKQKSLFADFNQVIDSYDVPIVTGD